MTTYTNTLVLELLVRSNELNKGLKQAGNDARAAGEEMNKFRESASRSLSFIGSIGLGAGVFLGIKRATQAYGEFINQAATAEQVFGSSFGELEKSMEGAVESFGLSNTEFLKSTTLLAGLGKSAGIAEKDLAKFSTTLTSLGADLAAAFNTNVSDAVAAIQSGFSGSSIEPLRRYNIVLNDTILKNEYFALTGEKVTGVLTQQQRMAAFLSKLYKESADYQGQWGRESEQFLGTMQRLGATVGNAAIEVGRSFEPAITAAGNALIPVIGGITDLNSALGGFPATVALMGGALFALKTPISIVESELIRLGSSADIAGPKLTKFQNIQRIASNTIAGIGPVTLVAGAAMIAFAGYTAAARKEAEDLDAAFKDLTENVKKVDASNLRKVVEDLTTIDPGFLESLFTIEDTGTKASIEEIQEKLNTLADTSPRTVAALLSIVRSGGDISGVYMDTAITADMLTAALSKQNDEAELTVDQQKDIDAILAEVAPNIQRNEDAWDDYAEALSGIAQEAKDAKDALLDVAEATQDIFEQTGDVDLERMKIFQSIQTWLDEAFAPRDEGETELDRQITNAENFQAILGQVSEAADAAALGLEGVAAVDAKISFLQNLRDELAVINPELAALVDGLITDLQGVQVDITLADEQAQAQVDAFISANSSRSVVADMLIDTGIAEGDANKFLEQFSDKEILEITTRAVTKLAEEDIDALNDEERVAEVVIEALSDDAVDKINEMEDGEYKADITVAADTFDFIKQINEIRAAQAKKPINIPIRVAGTGTGTGSSTTTTEPQGFAAPLAVTAGQPITNNVYVTVPTADPSATMRAIQRWSRDNGAIPVSRGRG